jgi:copper chaperone CopZ
MRQLLGAAVAAVALAGLGAAPVRAAKVEITGVHLCCKRCVTMANECLSKVEGVSEAKADQKTKTITFTSKDEKTTTAAIAALMAAGYYGKVTHDGGDVDVTTNGGPRPGDKANVVTIKNVHICCGACQKALTGLFKNNKVTFSGSGAIKDVSISGKNLDKAEVLETLKKGGFWGKVE